MTGTAEVPVEWFGELVPRVGDDLELVVVCRVSKIEQDQIDIRNGAGQHNRTIGGKTRVTLVLSELKMNMDEIERLLELR